MKEKIRKHFDMLFEAAPKTRKAIDLKEEMTQNAIDKYDDLINDGYSEEDAFGNVTASIGDVSELFDSLKESSLPGLSVEERKKKALFTSVAVGLYIFAGVVFLGCAMIEESFFGVSIGRIDWATLGLVLAALICIAPTCMLIYVANMYPDYRKKEDNLVEEYKESHYLSDKNKAVKNAISAIIWMLILVLYFVTSFMTMAWYITWVLFLVGACAQAVLELIFSLKRGE